MRRRVFPGRFPGARMSLAGQVLTLQLALVVVVLVVVAWVSVVLANADWRRTEGARLLSTAESVAAQRVVRIGLADPTRVGALHAPAEGARSTSGASFVEIARLDRRVLTAADPRRVGEPLELGGSDVLAGRSWVGSVTAVGGETSLVAHVPVFGEDGRLLGVVAVGSEERSLLGRVEAAAPDLLLYLGIASGLGVAGSYLLARRIKRQTMGLEPGEITALVEHREAMLHGITEGVVGLDRQGRVTLANDSGRELLGLPPDAAGRTLDELGVERVLREALTGPRPDRDRVVVTRERVLTLNRMPLVSHGQAMGSVTTLRDLTELTALQHQLDTTRSATDTLRAQAHEFSNHLHVIAGLVELAEYPEVGRYVRGISGTHARRTARVQAAVADPSLAALLVAKASLAAEQGTALRIAQGSALGALPESLVSDLVTVIGNLVDNALEAVRGGGPDAWVEVALSEHGDGEADEDADEVRVRVRDSGPGVAPEVGDAVFRQGFSTKAGDRGLGLAITRLVCGRRGGDVAVDGSAFLARLPRTPPARQPSAAETGATETEVGP